MAFTDKNDIQSKITSLKYTIAILEDALEGRITENINSYSINGKEVQKMVPRELTELHNWYNKKLNILIDQQKAGDGQAVLKIKTRFI